ncbi:MAG: type II toxin-antitoxin system RelE/ParE family toxin [Bryobacterales bacterium]|nr:type II toxin-antitoxin system RelE/ParE family toxin [Bryobacterales bacterium]
MSKESGDGRQESALPPEFRLRVGDYRIRYREHGGFVEILRVRHRRDAYR